MSHQTPEQLAAEYRKWAEEHGSEWPRSKFTQSDPEAWRVHLSERKKLQDPFFRHLAASHLTLTQSQKQAVKDILLATTVDLQSLKLAADNILRPLNPDNSFDHAGSKLVANLQAECDAILEERAKRERWAKIEQQMEEQGRRELEAELAARRAREAVNQAINDEDDVGRELE